MEKIVDKIRKLLAKAADSATTEAEASLFAAKAHELMIANELDIADVADNEEESLVGKDILDVKYAEGWRRWLAASVAQYYLCDFVCSKAYDLKGKLRPRFLFIGRKSRTSVTKEMYMYLEATCVRLAKVHTKDREAQLGFERGCGMGLALRLDRLTAAAKAPPPDTGGAAGLPALYDQAKLENDAVLASMDLKTRMLKVSGGAGFGAGLAAAKDVSLSAQVGSGKAPGTAVLK